MRNSIPRRNSIHWNRRWRSEANAFIGLYYIKERSVDPRALTTAAIKAAKHREVDFSSGDPVTSVDQAERRVAGVTTTKTTFHAPRVVNCAGAWSSQIQPHAFPYSPGEGANAYAWSLPGRC